MIDRYYTPMAIAKDVVSLGASSRTSVVADFAAGEGRLLRAAQDEWQTGHIAATDADPNAVKHLRRNYPSWSVGRCDFLSAVSRRQSRVLREIKGEVTAALLNPPFSYRGGTRWDVRLHGRLHACSPAAAFLTVAI